MEHRRFYPFAGLAAALAMWVAGAAAQVPPRRMNAYVLIDTGPVRVPAACPCISSPFTVPTPRPGWGYASGPAAPSENAEPSGEGLKRQAKSDAEHRARLPLLVEQAQAGNGNASIEIALKLTAGTPGPRENEQAARWFGLAASQDHSDAFIRLAHIYSRGIGVPQDDRTAAYWYRTAAARGDKNAMVALGLLHAAGRGVNQDWSTGARWWAEAAPLPIASRFLGDAYACGLGVDRDQERAVAEYRRSADAGELSSSVQLGHMYRSGCAVGSDEMMVAAYQKAADQGDPEAQVALSAILFEGRAVEQNSYRAYFWARLAERRLPPGELRASAHAHAAKAARLLSAFELQDAEKFIEGVISSGATPMR
jgi:TPR repeat protein